ncbi:MAG: AAA family ATPase [Alphaproteobacteria bacterium]|nr:AAA family ATPase [Alphaproteobacteria bacterium]
MKQDKTPIKGQNVIALASGKGGVGKTWLSVAVAQTLADKGEKVLLVDGDLGLPNVDIQLGLPTENDLSAVVGRRISLSDAVTKYAVGGFDVIANASGSGTLANMPLSVVAQVFENLLMIAPHYDRVVLDLGAGIDKAVRLMASCAGTLFIVCTDEPTSLTDAYAFIKVMLSENANTDMRVLVNGVDSLESGRKTYLTLARACENFLSFTPVFGGIVREDKYVREAIRKQMPVPKAFPQTTATEDVSKIVQNCLLNS